VFKLFKKYASLQEEEPTVLRPTFCDQRFGGVMRALRFSLLLLAGLAVAIQEFQEVIATDAVLQEEGAVVPADIELGSFAMDTADEDQGGSFGPMDTMDAAPEMSYSPAEVTVGEQGGSFTPILTGSDVNTYVPTGATESAEDVVNGETSSVHFDLGVREALMEGTTLIMTVQAFNQRKQEYLAEALAATLAVEPESLFLTFSPADITEQEHINNRWELAKGVTVDVYVIAPGGDIDAEKSTLEGLVGILEGDTFLTDFTRTLGLIQSIGGDIAKIDPESVAYSPRTIHIQGTQMVDYAIAKMQEEERLGTDTDDENDATQLLLRSIDASLPPTFAPTFAPFVELTYNISTVPGVTFEDKQSNLRHFKNDVNSILEEFIDKEYGVDKGMRPERIHAEIEDLAPAADGDGDGDGDGGNYDRSSYYAGGDGEEGYYDYDYEEGGDGAADGATAEATFEEQRGPYADEYGNIVMGYAEPTSSYQDQDGSAGGEEGGSYTTSMDGPIEPVIGDGESGDGEGDGEGGEAAEVEAVEGAEVEGAEVEVEGGGPFPGYGPVPGLRVRRLRGGAGGMNAYPSQ
jgi:hypothetical protein